MKEGTGKCREEELPVHSPRGRSIIIIITIIIIIACQIPHDATYMWDLKNRNKFIDREQTNGCQRGGVDGWVKRVKFHKKYKLPVIK